MECRGQVSSSINSSKYYSAVFRDKIKEYHFDLTLSKIRLWEKQYESYSEDTICDRKVY